MRRTVLNVLTLVLALLSTASRATTITIGAARDNTIFQHNSNNSSGGAAGLRAGTNGSGSPRRGLIAFDIAGSVPVGSSITAVELTLYLGDTTQFDIQDIGLHKLMKDWGEGTAGSSNPALGGTGMGSPANPGDATWSHAMLGSVPWTNDGAQGDFNAVASATASVNDTLDAPFRWSSTAALVNDVQSWLDAPATNFGWALINQGEETIRSLKVFYSREATQNSSGVANSLDPTWRPSLIITYLESPSPSGDYNNNGVVDAADYVLWRDGGPLANEVDAPGTVNSADYTAWRARFGNTGSGATGFASAIAIPEPASIVLLIAAAACTFRARRGNRSQEKSGQSRPRAQFSNSSLLVPISATPR